MVIDTSALVAILTGESEAARLASAIAEARVRLLSTATRVEVGIVIESRYGPQGTRELELLLRKAEINLEPVTPGQADVAFQAWLDYGKGRHPSGLNYGDCFSYALARDKGEPLLFKGDDFSKTDISAVFY